MHGHRFADAPLGRSGPASAAAGAAARAAAAGSEAPPPVERGRGRRLVRRPAARRLVHRPGRADHRPRRDHRRRHAAPSPSRGGRPRPRRAPGRIARFREETREQRMAIADAAQERYGRKVAWGAACGDTRELFTTLSVPVMTRLRQPERLVLDTLVDAGVARSRSEALAWAVRLVGQHADEWLAELRDGDGVGRRGAAAGARRGLSGWSGRLHRGATWDTRRRACRRRPLRDRRPGRRRRSRRVGGRGLGGPRRARRRPRRCRRLPAGQDLRRRPDPPRHRRARPARAWATGCAATPATVACGRPASATSGSCPGRAADFPDHGSAVPRTELDARIREVAIDSGATAAGRRPGRGRRAGRRPGHRRGLRGRRRRAVPRRLPAAGRGRRRPVPAGPGAGPRVAPGHRLRRGRPGLRDAPGAATTSGSPRTWSSAAPRASCCRATAGCSRSAPPRARSTSASARWRPPAVPPGCS